MTRAEFVREIARRAKISEAEAARVVDAFLETITDVLRRRDSITFTGFGKFSTSDRAAREGVNPRNPSQKAHIPAATVPKFSAGSQLKAAVPHSGGGGRGAARSPRRSRAPIRANGGGGARPATPAAAPVTPPSEKHINAWIEGRGGRPRRAQLERGQHYALKLNAGEPVDGRILQGDTEVDTSGFPDDGLLTEWVLMSRSVRLEPATGEPLEVSRVGTRGPWMAKFQLRIPKHTDSETRTVLVTPNARSNGRIDVLITVGGEIYRELIVGLDVASAGRQPKRMAAAVERELVHTPAAHLNLRPPHEWTTAPGTLTISVSQTGSSAFGDTGTVAVMQPIRWFGSPAAVANPIQRVQSAAENFRGQWEDYLNAIDGDDLAARLQRTNPFWWGTEPVADRHHTEAWQEVSHSSELHDCAAEGRLLYETVFPPNSELRPWLDSLQRGHRLNISWLDVDTGSWVPHMPWGLMYTGDIPPLGQPIDPTQFLALHLRIGYTSHFVPAGSKALGNPHTTYCGNFLYWGAGANDPVAEEAARQRAEIASWQQQLIWPTTASGNPKAELLVALEEPAPSPVGVLYLFCQSSYGARKDDPMLGFAFPTDAASAVRPTELGVRTLDERPFVFANACTSGASDAYFANDLEQAFFRRGARAFLGTETKVPIAFASRFARVFFHFFYRQGDPAPMAAGEAVAQTRLFLWHHYRNVGGIFYTHVNQYELFMADDAEVTSMNNR